MKKKYIIVLSIIGSLLLFNLVLATGYGLLVATKNDKAKNSILSECFKVYFSNTDTIEMRNVKAVINEEGIETSPHTLTITNICETEKELQLRLNILNDTTVDTKSLVVNATGHIEHSEKLYNELDRTKTTDKNVKESKLVGQIKISPNETIRTNIKLWFNEKKDPNLEKNGYLKARFELIDASLAIKATFAEMLIPSISAVEGKKNPNFEETSTKNEGLFMTNDTNKVYYYRGSVNNNYVSFANQLWRITRINEDGSIRLILDKSSAYVKYSNYTNAIDYTGLKYIYYSDTIDNNINTYLLNWYNETIVNQGLDSYVVNSIFCNDSSYKTEKNHTYFGAYNRLVTDKAPTLTCPSTNADFGGNYTQKVGLITADEVVFAGGIYENDNTSYYLNNGEKFVTMTPSEYYYYNAYMMVVTETGALNKINTITDVGIRPVITLKSNLTVSGKGTQDNPYTIDFN